MQMPKAIDLFSGAGGLTQGLKDAGFAVVAAVENQDLAVETYSLNHDDVEVVGEDIRNVCPYALMDKLGLGERELDLLAGCPPCQGFSKLRTRNKFVSAVDDRNDLIFVFLDFVKAFLPKAIMLENVPYLAKDGRMEEFLNSVRQLGYKVDKESVKIEDASLYGVPQRRKRMIFIASRLGKLNSPEPVGKKATVRDAIGDMPQVGQSGDLLHDVPAKRSPRVAEVIKHIPKNGGSRFDLPEHLQLECHKKYPKGFRDVYGRMSWDDVSPTITGGCHNPSKGRFLHPEHDRAITLREAALLQTFPSDYKFSLRGGKDKAALMIGNALPPLFIKAHAELIKEGLEG